MARDIAGSIDPFKVNTPDVDVLREMLLRNQVPYKETIHVEWEWDEGVKAEKEKKMHCIQLGSATSGFVYIYFTDGWLECFSSYEYEQ